MGVRGELFSTKVSLQNRTYFFNVKENRLGDLYLNIVESKNRDEGGFERQSVILFAEDLEVFLQGFDESLRVLEKAVREKRRGQTDKRERREEKSYGDRAETPAANRKSAAKYQETERFQDKQPRDGKRFFQEGRQKGSRGEGINAGRRSDTGRRFDADRRSGAKGTHGLSRTPNRARAIGKPQDQRSRDRPKSSGDFGPKKKRVIIKKR